MSNQTKASIDVMAERARQVTEEGWDAEHDDANDNGEIGIAAGCYAIIAHLDEQFKCRPLHDWPWDSDWWKPTTTRRDLVKAGALILAEIERLDRTGVAP